MFFRVRFKHLGIAIAIACVAVFLAPPENAHVSAISQLHRRTTASRSNSEVSVSPNTNRPHFPRPPTEVPDLFLSGNFRSWYGNMMLRLVTGDKDAEYEVLRELLWVNSFGDQEAYAYKVLFLLQRKVKSMQAWYGGGLVPVLQQMADPTNAFFDEQLPATFWPPAPTKPQIMPALFATGDVRSWFGNMMQRLATAGPSEAEKAAVEEQILSELMWLHPWEEEAYKSLWDVKRKVESLVAIYAGDPQGFDMALKAAATEDTTSRFLDGLKSRVVTTTTGR